MRGHYNPYMFDLALARLLGWAWWILAFVLGFMFATGQPPEKLDGHGGAVLWTMLLALLVIGVTETALTKKATQFEYRMRGISIPEDVA